MHGKEKDDAANGKPLLVCHINLCCLGWANQEGLLRLVLCNVNVPIELAGPLRQRSRLNEQVAKTGCGPDVRVRYRLQTKPRYWMTKKAFPRSPGYDANFRVKAQQTDHQRSGPGQFALIPSDAHRHAKHCIVSNLDVSSVCRASASRFGV